MEEHGAVKSQKLQNSVDSSSRTVFLKSFGLSWAQGKWPYFSRLLKVWESYFDPSFKDQKSSAVEHKRKLILQLSAIA